MPHLKIQDLIPRLHLTTQFVSITDPEGSVFSRVQSTLCCLPVKLQSLLHTSQDQTDQADNWGKPQEVLNRSTDMGTLPLMALQGFIHMILHGTSFIRAMSWARIPYPNMTLMISTYNSMVQKAHTGIFCCFNTSTNLKATWWLWIQHMNVISYYTRTCKYSNLNYT